MRVPQYEGIVIPTDAMEDFQLALTRRNQKKWRQRTGAPFQEKMEAFHAHRADGVSARRAIAVDFLKRVGYPMDELSGDNQLGSFKSLRDFEKGSTKSAKELMPLNVKRLKDIANEFGIKVKSSFSKPRLVKEIVAETPDKAIFEAELAESYELREEIKRVLMRDEHKLMWLDWRNRRVASSTRTPNVSMFVSTADAVAACLKYRQEMVLEAEEVADIRKVKRIRHDALVQCLNGLTGSAFGSALTPGPSLPADIRNLLECTVEIEDVEPIEEMDDFCRVLNEVKQIGGLSTRYGTVVLHARTAYDAYTTTPGYVGDFCFKCIPSRPLKFFDDIPAEVAVRVADFLVELECKNLVEAAPSMRAPIYVRLKTSENVCAERVLPSKRQAEKEARDDAAAAIREARMRDYAASQSARFGDGMDRFLELVDEYDSEPDDFEHEVDVYGNPLNHIMNQLFHQQFLDVDDDEISYCDGCGEYH